MKDQAIKKLHYKWYLNIFFQIALTWRIDVQVWENFQTSLLV